MQEGYVRCLLRLLESRRWWFIIVSTHRVKLPPRWNMKSTLSMTNYNYIETNSRFTFSKSVWYTEIPSQWNRQSKGTSSPIILCMYVCARALCMLENLPKSTNHLNVCTGHFTFFALSFQKPNNFNGWLRQQIIGQTWSQRCWKKKEKTSAKLLLSPLSKI